MDNPLFPKFYFSDRRAEIEVELASVVAGLPALRAAAAVAKEAAETAQHRFRNFIMRVNAATSVLIAKFGDHCWVITGDDEWGSGCGNRVDGCGNGQNWRAWRTVGEPRRAWRGGRGLCWRRPRA